jgi:hypothetical protein
VLRGSTQGCKIRLKLRCIRSFCRRALGGGRRRRRSSRRRRRRRRNVRIKLVINNAHCNYTNFIKVVACNTTSNNTLPFDLQFNSVKNITTDKVVFMHIIKACEVWRYSSNNSQHRRLMNVRTNTNMTAKSLLEKETFWYPNKNFNRSVQLCNQYQ